MKPRIRYSWKHDIWYPATNGRPSIDQIRVSFGLNALIANKEQTGSYAGNGLPWKRRAHQ